MWTIITSVELPIVSTPEIRIDILILFPSWRGDATLLVILIDVPYEVIEEEVFEKYSPLVKQISQTYIYVKCLLTTRKV